MIHKPNLKTANKAATLFITAWMCLGAFQSQALANGSGTSMAERSKDIAQKLECLVCENDRLEQSQMPVAEELEIIIQTRLEAGDTDKEVIAYVSRNYANFVQPRPVFGGSAIVIWIIAALVLIGGGLFLWQIHKRREDATDQLLMEFSVRDRLAKGPTKKPTQDSDAGASE